MSVQSTTTAAMQAIAMAASKITDEKAGLAAQKKLEANAKSDYAAPMNVPDLMESYKGYQASNPQATLSDFAQQEAPKIGIDAKEIANMITTSQNEPEGPGIDIRHIG